MSADGIYEQLDEAIFAAGVAVEQIGPADGVFFDLHEGEITLIFGEEGEETFDELPLALARIAEYGADLGGDGTRPGAIVELVERLNKLVKGVPAAKRWAALCDRELAVDELVSRLGLTALELDDEVAEGETLLALEDGNGALWLVGYADGRVVYQPAAPAEDD